MPLFTKNEFDGYNPKNESQSNVGDIILAVVMMVFYILGWAVTLTAVIEKGVNPDVSNGYLYIIFLLIPHIFAGGKNLHYWWKEESMKNEEEQSYSSCLIHVVLWPFSPMIRLANALRFGMGGDSEDNQVRYVTESTTAGALLLFDGFLGDGVILSLLFRDDIWLNSGTWQTAIMGDDSYNPDLKMVVYVKCLPGDELDPLRPECKDIYLGTELHWPVARIVLLLCRISIAYTYFNMMSKRSSRYVNSEYYNHLQSSNAATGNVNPFGWLFSILSHFCYIASRTMGYGIAAAATGGWIYLIVGLRWLVQTVWGFIIYGHSGDSTPVRSLSPMLMGGVWLFGLTNEYGGPQMGRYLLYYGFSFAETSVCIYFWVMNMQGSGDFFEVKAPWSVFCVFMMGVVLNVFYYSLCHPGRPKFTSESFLCCSGDRRRMPTTSPSPNRRMQSEI